MSSSPADISPLVLAIVGGQAMTEMPVDLFIPPDALEVLLDTFSGPLDLLLYLIKKQNLDILDIPIAHITRQYMHYIEWIGEHRLELAADYLVMAAMLAEIKSRLLLPVNPGTDEEIEEDPRLILVRKLQAYEQMKEAAAQLDELPRCDRDFFRINLQPTALETIRILPEVQLEWLPVMMQAMMTRQGHQVNHQISREQLSVRERMACVLERLQHEKSLVLTQLFTLVEGRMGLTVSLLAILELARQSLLIINQTAAYAPVHIMAVEHG